MNKIILSTVLLVGCASAPEIIDSTVEKPLAAMPAPITVSDVTWKVEDGELALSTEDGVKLNLQFKDTVRYIKDLKSVICYYEDRHQFCGGVDEKE